jgi:hypothetical protein
MPSRRRFLRDSAAWLSGVRGAVWLANRDRAAGAPSRETTASFSSRDPQSSDVDVIIIGAGSSGCVIAHRLSANAQMRVLVIEAGGPDA